MNLRFESRGAFRDWLADNCQSGGGVWLLFDKLNGTTIKASEALEEALCFGWIDGQMKSIDGGCYIKYFAPRTKNSKWSDKNKAAAEALEKQGRMTGYGRAKIDEAKRNGQWDAVKTEITDDATAVLDGLLKEHQTAYANWQSMPPSVKRTYTRAYFDAKTDAGRESRLAWIIERLNKNLKPM